MQFLDEIISTKVFSILSRVKYSDESDFLQIFPPYTLGMKMRKLCLPVSHLNKVLVNFHPRVTIQIRCLTPSPRGYPAALAPCSGRFQKTPRALHFNLIIEANRRLASQSAVLRQQNVRITLVHPRSLSITRRRRKVADGCFATFLTNSMYFKSKSRHVETF